MTPPPDDPVQRLLRDTGWLRSFVGTLVPARHVDDVVQSTCVAALETGENARAPKQWLRGIARNLARMLHRSDGRRARRETRIANAAVGTSIVDHLAALEVQHAVSEALLALPEPTRTILVFRYREDLAPADIARRRGLEPAAVRQRLVRGREMVRARLQQRFGADWRGSAAVVAFARADEVAASVGIAGALVAIGITVTLVVGASIGVASARATGSDAVAGDALAANSNATGLRNEAAVPMQDATPTTRVLAATAAQEPGASTSTSSAQELRGRIVAAETGAPLAGARVTVDVQWSNRVPDSERQKTAVATTGVDGRFTIGWPQNAERWTVWFAADGRCRRWQGDAPHAADLGDVPLARGSVVRGRVVDENEQPIDGLRITVPLDNAFPAANGSISFPCKTAADGSFATTAVPAGATKLLCETPGIRLVDPTIEVAAEGPPQFFLLRAQRLPAIRGVVFGPDGAPCHDVALLAIDAANDPLRPEPPNGCGTCRSEKDGSFALFCEHGNPSEVEVRMSPFAAHELTARPIVCEWGASGVRVDVRPLVPVRLRVADAGDRTPIERFGHHTARRDGAWCHMIGSTTHVEVHPDGVVAFAGLAPGTQIVVLPADPALPPVQCVVEEWMRSKAVVELPIARMQSFPLTLVDARGAAVSTEFHVLDRCGDTEPRPFNDPRAGRTCSTSRCLRLSFGSTDAEGHATLSAPNRPDLVIALRRGERDVWLPLILPRPGEPVRIAVPD